MSRLITRIKTYDPHIVIAIVVINPAIPRGFGSDDIRHDAWSLLTPICNWCENGGNSKRLIIVAPLSVTVGTLNERGRSIVVTMRDAENRLLAIQVIDVPSSMAEANCIVTSRSTACIYQPGAMIGYRAFYAKLMSGQPVVLPKNLVPISIK